MTPADWTELSSERRLLRLMERAVKAGDLPLARQYAERARVAREAASDTPRSGPVAELAPEVWCERHARPMLDQRKVDALITLFGWNDPVVMHACERELQMARRSADLPEGWPFDD